MTEHVRSDTSTEEHSSLWRNRNFRRYFVGQFVTNAGDSLYAVAILWLVLQLSGSSALVGLANAMLLLPFLLQFVAGPIVDRLPLKGVMVGAQVVQGVVVLVLPLAAYANALSVGLLLAVIPALALVTLLMSPVQTTIVPRILPEGQLSRGNSALATVSLGLDMIFDALGGVFIALFGATALFLLDSATFALAAVLFGSMTIPSADGDGQDGETDSDPETIGSNDRSESVVADLRSALGEYRDDLREGIDVLRGTLFVEMLATAAVSNFAVGVTLATLPAFGALLGGAWAYGLLLGALGVGRLIGSASASYVNDLPFGRLMVVAYAGATVAWLGSVYAPSTALTVVLFGLAWVAGGIDGVLTATLNQRVFPSDLLGRVSSIKGTASTATLPLGSLVGGVVTQTVGATTTMTLAAFGFGFVGLYFAVRPRLRRLPPVADAGPADFGVDTDRPPAAADAGSAADAPTPEPEDDEE